MCAICISIIQQICLEKGSQAQKEPQYKNTKDTEQVEKSPNNTHSKCKRNVEVSKTLFWNYKQELENRLEVSFSLVSENEGDNIT